MNCFLSHSSNDKKWFVDQVYDRLPKESTIIDKNNFRAAAYIKSEIEQFIKISPVFVYFISNASLMSGWVQDEVKFAEELCKEGKIKLFIPILLDSSISHDDPRFSQWLQDNYNLKYLGGPKYVAKRILDEIFFLKLNLNPTLKAELSLCLGRHIETSSFTHRHDDFTKPELKMLIAAGIPKIGRKTFLRNILFSSQLKSASFCPYEITMDERSSLEDFIAKLEPISDTVCCDDLNNMLEQSIDKKKELAFKIINELSNRGEIILINDENCIIDYSGKFIPWFNSIITDVRFPKKLFFLLSSRKMLFCPPADVLCLTISELKHPDSISIFSRLLSIRKKVLSKSSMKFWTDLLVGHPGQIKYTINILEKNGYDEALAEKESYQVKDYLANQAAVTLHKYLTDSGNAHVMRFFALAEFASFELYGQIFQEGKYTDILRNLIDSNILEFIGENHDFIRLNGVFRDYVLRNTDKFGNDIVEKIKSLTNNFIKNEFNKEDVSQSLFLATAALENSDNISIDKLFPVHIIKAIVNIYNRGDNYNRVIELANSLLGYKNNIAPNIVHDALYYKCLSLARQQDRAVLSEIQQLPFETGTFVKGFFYRRTGRALDAISEFNKIKNERFIGHRARREIVLALQQLEQYDEALALARDNYILRPDSHYNVQALFKCLIHSSEIEDNKDIKNEAKYLIEILKKFTNEQAKEMAMLAEAQYHAFIEKNFTLAYDTTSDAINQFPDSKYPILVQMDIALKNGNYSVAKATNELIYSYLSIHKKVPSRIFVRSIAYFLSGSGHIADAKNKLSNEIDRLDEAGKEKLISKLDFYDMHRLK